MTSILESTETEKANFKSRIPRELDKRIKRLHKRLKAEAPTLTLNTDLIVEKALADAVTKAFRELESLNEEQQDHTVTGD